MEPLKAALSSRRNLTPYPHFWVWCRPPECAGPMTFSRAESMRESTPTGSKCRASVMESETARTENERAEQC